MISFNSSRTRLIDQQGENLLVAGNLPVRQKDGRHLFCMESLTASINSCLQTGNWDINGLAPQMSQLPEKFYLVSFSLMRHTDLEGRYLDIQSSYFDANPARGQLIHDDLDRMLTLGLIKDDLGKQLEQRLIKRLQNMMKTTLPCPVVVYLHSAAGLDRTGMAVYCYAMRTAGFALHDVIYLNRRARLRQIDSTSLLAVEQYAHYLKRFLGVTSVGDTDLMPLNDLLELAEAQC